MSFGRMKHRLPTAEEALPGRPQRPYDVPERHLVLGTQLEGPVPPGFETAYFALGCFWGAERSFWETPGVWTTVAGYQGGTTPHPSYQEVCSGLTGHAETVKVVYDPGRVSYDALLKVFWEAHDPTQGHRQGNDVGTQYRSAVHYASEEQRVAAEQTRAAYQEVLSAAGYGPITTEIVAAGPFYAAEDYHQQYLARVPDGYCGLGGTGLSCPVGLGVSSQTRAPGDADTRNPAT